MGQSLLEILYQQRQLSLSTLTAAPLPWLQERAGGRCLCCWLGQGRSGAVQSCATAAFPRRGSEDHQEWKNTQSNWMRDWRHPWSAMFHTVRTLKCWQTALDINASPQQHMALERQCNWQTVCCWGLRLRRYQGDYWNHSFDPLISSDNLRSLTGTTFLHNKEKQWTPQVSDSKIKLCTKTCTYKPTQAQMHSSTTEDFSHTCGRNSQQKGK